MHEATDVPPILARDCKGHTVHTSPEGCVWTYKPEAHKTHANSLVLPCKETRPVSHCVHVSLLVVFLKNPVLHDTHRVLIRSNPGVHTHSVIDTVPANYFMELGLFIYEICFIFWHTGQYLHTSCSSRKLFIFFLYTGLMQQKHTKKRNQLSDILTLRDVHACVFIY